MAQSIENYTMIDELEVKGILSQIYNTITSMHFDSDRVLRLASPVISASFQCDNCTTSNLSTPVQVMFKHSAYDEVSAWYLACLNGQLNHENSNRIYWNKVKTLQSNVYFGNLTSLICTLVRSIALSNKKNVLHLSGHFIKATMLVII